MNTPQNLDIKEFFTPGKTLEKAHVILHLAEPSAPHEKERGYLFILMELMVGTTSLIETSQKIIQYLEDRYYAREEKNEYLLERILQSVNREFEDVLTEHASDITCLVGTIMDGTITLSYHGAPQAAVFYWQQNQLQSYSIIEGADEGENKNFFSDLVTGTINNKDFFYAATPHVVDYFPLDRVLKLLSDRPVKDVSSHLQKVLQEIGSDYSFGGLIAQLNKKIVPKLGPEKTGSAASLNHLVTAADRTAETLSPPLIKDVKTTLSKLKERTKQLPLYPTYLTRENRRQWGQTPPESFLHSFGKVMVGAGQTLVAIFMGTAKGIMGAGKSVYRLVRSQRSRLDEMNEWRGRMENTKRSLNSLPPISRYLTIGLIVTAILFVGTLSYRKIYERRVAKQDKITNLASAITDKKEAAEASLAYEDKAKANILVNEGFALVRELRDTEPDYEQLAKLETDLQTLADRLRNERRVEPELLADLSQVNAGSQPLRLIGFGSTVIAYGPNDASWYFINAITKEVQGKQHEALSELVDAAADPESNLIAMRSGSGEVGLLDTDTQTLVKKNLSLPSATAELKNIALYNENLYTIDSVNNRIYKHNLTQTGFDQGSAWTKSGESHFGGGGSLAIDGDVYLLKDSGSMYKWYRGDEQGFSLAPVEPALTSTSGLVVPAEANELFILDTSGKRVLIFDKSGAFKEQLVSHSWTNPTGLWVDKTAKNLFVLDGQKVYHLAR